MFPAREDLSFGSRVTRQRSSDDDSWHVLQPFEQLAEELLSRLGIASALQQDMQHIAMLIDSAPQGVPLAVDGEKHLIQIGCLSKLIIP